MQMDDAIPAGARMFFRTPDLNHFSDGLYDILTARSGCQPFEASWDP